MDVKKATGPFGPWLRAGTLLAVVVAGVAGFRLLGLAEYLRPSNFQSLAQAVEGLGWIGPLAYVLLWVAACMFFVPGLPVTLLGAAVFGAWQGLLWVTVGANLGAVAAFLAGRYAARPLVESWAGRNPYIAKIEEGVARHGWRMLLVTRLVPLFPFNLQNYAYGLTPIRVGTYSVVTFLCMLPASAAYCFAGGALVSGQGSLGKTLGYLAVAAGFFVAASLVPGWVRRRYGPGDAA
ncbi:MAG: TVP38/TMEM64 family protein [Thermodesulfobacteriota bacterium]|jgi:uncharacterized membrane protein YdjX (TVP38/TMEM64 family)